MKRLTVFIISFFTILIVAYVFYSALKFKPKYSTDHLVGSLVAKFNTPTLKNNKTFFTDEDIKLGEYSLINIWASWCTPCRKEHPVLMELSKISNLNMYGINFKDNKKNALNFLNDFGNPFLKNGVDKDGSISINLGAYGVPETILIDKNKKILLKYIGPLDKSDYKKILEKIKN